jgi:hypothetical protein
VPTKRSHLLKKIVFYRLIYVGNNLLLLLLLLLLLISSAFREVCVTFCYNPFSSKTWRAMVMLTRWRTLIYVLWVPEDLNLTLCLLRVFLRECVLGFHFCPSRTDVLDLYGHAWNIRDNMAMLLGYVWQNLHRLNLHLKRMIFYSLICIYVTMLSIAQTM